MRPGAFAFEFLPTFVTGKIQCQGNIAESEIATSASFSVSFVSLDPIFAPTILV